MCRLRSYLIVLKTCREPKTYVLYMGHGEKNEEILPLLIEDVTNEPQKLDLKPLTVELKYAYLEENEQCPAVISSLLNVS